MVQISVAYPTGLSPQNTVFGVTVSTATAGTQRDRPMLALPRNNIFDLRTSISRGYCQWSLEWSSIRGVCPAPQIHWVARLWCMAT